MQDSLGEKRETFPLTCYCVSGSQSEHGHLNHVIVMKMENLHRTTKEKKEETEEEDEESEEEEEEEDDEKQPELETALIKHNGAINRIRVLKNYLFLYHHNSYNPNTCLYGILEGFFFKCLAIYMFAVSQFIHKN